MLVFVKTRNLTWNWFCKRKVCIVLYTSTFLGTVVLLTLTVYDSPVFHLDLRLLRLLLYTNTESYTHTLPDKCNSWPTALMRQILWLRASHLDEIMIFNRWHTVMSGTWKYVNPRLNTTFSTEGHIIPCPTNDHATICFVIWPTTSLKLYIVFWDSSVTRVCHSKMHTVLITARG